jgi:hypothetical protein
VATLLGAGGCPYLLIENHQEQLLLDKNLEEDIILRHFVRNLEYVRKKNYTSGSFVL